MRQFRTLFLSQGWTILRVLTVCTLLYLIWQMSLSAAILSAESIETSQRLSDLARLTVGFGTALFVFRVAYARLGYFVAILLALIFGFVAMKTEDAIVNSLADNTSAQARLEAKTIQLFNTALAQGKVTLPDLPGEIATNTVKIKAFAKVLGFAIWNNPVLIREVSAKTSSVLNALYGQEMYHDIDAGYDRYAASFAQAADKVTAMQDALSRINFAAYAHDLNGQLVEYSICNTDACRRKIAERVQQYMTKILPDSQLEIDLNAFCKDMAKPVRYIMGKPILGPTKRICSTSENNLYMYVLRQIEAAIESVFIDLELPEKVKTKILKGSLLSLEEWRNVWEDYVVEEIEKRKIAEFSNPEQYSDTGEFAQKGKAFAVAVFLPPIALGFSVTVCFLHLTSLCATLTRRPRLCCFVASIVYFLPVFFAAPVPIGGLAGVYARWLVFWEGTLFPFGILKCLIL